MKFNVLKNEISKWLKNLKRVFETISKRKLLSYYERIDYEITLKTEKIKSLSLISIRLEEQEIVKEYLNIMIRKNELKLVNHL